MTGFPWTPLTDARRGEPRLLDRVRLAVRARHYSLRTEESYVAWVRRFVVFHGKRHPIEMGEPEINAFLSDLAVHGRVGASTQNQALAALLFLYRNVLAKPLPALDVGSSPSRTFNTGGASASARNCPARRNRSTFQKSEE